MAKPVTKLPLALAIAATIRRIPRGKVSTYGGVARAAGYPLNSRHVSKVLNQTPNLPWHRVLGSGGRISLPRELGMEQRFLLEAEGVRLRGKKVDLTVFEHRFPGSGRSPRQPVGEPKPTKKWHRLSQ